MGGQLRRQFATGTTAKCNENLVLCAEWEADGLNVRTLLLLGSVAHYVIVLVCHFVRLGFMVRATGIYRHPIAFDLDRGLQIANISTVSINIMSLFKNGYFYNSNNYFR